MFVARVADVYAALPAITGKMELEYEGNQGPRKPSPAKPHSHCVGRVFSAAFTDVNFQPVNSMV